MQSPGNTVTHPLTVSYSCQPCAGRRGAGVLLSCCFQGGHLSEDLKSVCTAAVALQQGAGWDVGVNVAPRCG